MRVISGDWNILEPPPGQVNAVCITTNGVRKANGLAVMGAGVALAAAKKWPELPTILGTKLRWEGLHTTLLLETKTLHVVAFPTKRHWKNKSDISLIETSAKELVDMANDHMWEHVWLPPAGCGCGGLFWTNVAAVLNPILDNRFTVVFRR